MIHFEMKWSELAVAELDCGARGFVDMLGQDCGWSVPLQTVAEASRLPHFLSGRYARTTVWSGKLQLRFH